MIFVLLPAFNEEKSLPGLLPKLHTTLTDLGEGFRVVVCNDGSEDQTAMVLEQFSTNMPITVLQHKINRGLGETIRDLIEWVCAHGSEADIAIRLDCDDTHEPEYIRKMVEKIREGADVVIASRFQVGGGQQGVGKYRAFISYCANWFMKIFFPIKGVREYSCAYRAYRVRVLKACLDQFGNNFIQLKGLGFTCTLEKLVKVSLIGANISEIPFVLRYDQKESESKMVSSVTTLGYLTMVILHHWPWGGWRSMIRNHTGRSRSSPDS